MKIYRVAALILLSAFASVASAVPLATMTFDVDFVGTARLPSGNILLQESARTSATLVFPVQIVHSNLSAGMYSRDLVTNLSWTGVEKHVSISSAIDQYFMGEVMDRYIRQGLSELGLNSNFVATPSLNYANLLKRQSPGSDASTHYNMFDASTNWVNYDLEGDPNAMFTSMIRLWGVGNIEHGGLDAFDAANIPQMLIDIAHANQGYTLQYTIFVDRFRDIQTHEFLDRPIEITYGGTAHLSSFSIDGRNILQADVPEPPTFALLMLGIFACLHFSSTTRSLRV